MGKIHIGKKIKEVLGQSHFTVVEFADKINKSRTVVYDIFERDSIDTSLLIQIGRVLEYDFFGHLSPENLKDEKTLYQRKRDAELHTELESLKKRVIELEKRNILLEKLVALMEDKDLKRARKKVDP